MLHDLLLSVSTTPSEAAPDLAERALDYLTRHRGFDWGALVTASISLWRLGDRKIDGFVWGVISNLFWIAFNLNIEPWSPAGVIANLFFLTIQIRAWINWNKDAQTDPTHAHAADQAPTTNA